MTTPSSARASPPNQREMCCVGRRPLSQHGKKLRLKFESTKDSATSEGWRRADEEVNEYAAELLALHEASRTMEEMDWEKMQVGYSVFTENDEENGLKLVTHLGQGVFVQHNSIGIDPDSESSPKTITTAETRKFAKLCLDKTLGPNKKLVFGTGQPRIGKTRGALTYTLQELLWRGEAVMRVGYKDSAVYLFLPQENGSYVAWTRSTTGWASSWLAAEKSMFALLDPPENRDYERAARCHVIVYCSNSERHLLNAEKDGQIVLTKMPKLDEILCMSDALLDHDVFPINLVKEGENGEQDQVIQIQSFETRDERREELIQRCSLVGCVPGIVFSGKEFINKLSHIRMNAAKESDVLSLGGLINFYKGGVVGNNKSTIASMSRYFLVDSNDTGREYARVRLNEATSFYIRERLQEKLASFTGSNAFDFEDICALLLKEGSLDRQNKATGTAARNTEATNRAKRPRRGTKNAEEQRKSARQEEEGTKQPATTSLGQRKSKRIRTATQPPTEAAPKATPKAVKGNISNRRRAPQPPTEAAPKATPKAVKGKTSNRGRALQPRKIVCGAHWHDTSELILSLKSGPPRVVRASNCYPVLDFATAPNQWFNAKVGSSPPKISLSAFVTVMLHLKMGVIDDKGNLVVREKSPKISLDLIRNQEGESWSFDEKMADMYANMKVDQIKAVFEKHVTVKVLNTANWTPEDMIQAFEERMALTEQMLTRYAHSLAYFKDGTVPKQLWKG